MRKLVAGAAAAVTGLAATGVAIAQISTGVPNANPASGSPANLVATGFTSQVVARGSNLLENPTGIYQTYGYLADNADPLARTRTEPDQNTYLVANGVGGPTDGYDYGTHFLIQGHENGGDKAYLTRINLDVTDPEHRVTLLNRSQRDGTTGLTTIDGSTPPARPRTRSATRSDAFTRARPCRRSGSRFTTRPSTAPPRSTPTRSRRRPARRR